MNRGSCWLSWGSHRRSRCGGLHGSRGHASLRRSCSRCGGLQPRRFRCSFLRFFLRFGGRFRLRLGFRNSLNSFPNLLRNVDGNRARMRLLLRDAKTGQKINDRFGLHFQFAGQLVDSDLICVSHALRFVTRTPVTGTLLTPALLLPLVLPRFPFPQLELRLARLPQAPSLLQQRLRLPQKLPQQPVVLQQFPSSLLLQPL